MRTHGKKYRAAVGTIEPRKLYPPPAAVEQVKNSAFAKFDESVDVAVRLGVDPKHADQIVRGTVSLPHGTGKTIRVLVIAQGEKIKEAEAAGADFVGIEYIAKIKEEEPTEAIPFLVGQVVEITEGPFSDFSGTVQEVLPDKGKVRVSVALFGRPTSVELDYLQLKAH